MYIARNKGGRGTNKCKHTLSMIRRVMPRTIPWDHSLETSLNKPTVWVPSPCPIHLLKTNPSGHQEKVSSYVNSVLKIPSTPKLMGHTKQVSLMGAQGVFQSQHASWAVCWAETVQVWADPCLQSPPLKCAPEPRDIHLLFPPWLFW